MSAIEIGTSKVTVLIAAFDSKGAVQILGAGRSSHNAVHRGAVLEESQVVDAISEAIIKAERMAAVPLSNPLVGIPGTHISAFVAGGSVTITRLGSKVQPADIDRVIEAAKARAVPLGRRIIGYEILEFTVDDVHLAASPLGQQARYLGADVQFVTLSLAALESYRACLAKAGLKSDKIIPSSIAASYSVLTLKERAEGVILVDVGAGLCEFAVYKDAILQDLGCLPVGTENFIQDLIVGLNITKDEARHLLQTVGLRPAQGLEHVGTKLAPGVSSEVLEGCNRILAARGEEIWQLINEAVTNVNLGRSRPKYVKLVGGGALVPGFRELGTAIMDSSIEVAQPASVAGLPEAWQNPSSAVCVGLISHQIDGLAKSAGDIKQSGMIHVPWQKIRTWLGFQ
ncbi:MAG: cell division protein FtsA [Firmicutes bacterium]|nr:cell division protein FtsA [Bacillota bacterium]